MSRFPDASSYFCKSLGLRGFEFQLYIIRKMSIIYNWALYKVTTIFIDIQHLTAQILQNMKVCKMLKYKNSDIQSTCLKVRLSICTEYLHLWVCTIFNGFSRNARVTTHGAWCVKRCDLHVVEIMITMFSIYIPEKAKFSIPYCFLVYLFLKTKTEH